MSAAAWTSSSLAEVTFSSVKRKLGPEAENEAMTSPWASRTGADTAVKVASARDLLTQAAADISARLGWREH